MVNSHWSNFFTLLRIHPPPGQKNVSLILCGELAVHWTTLIRNFFITPVTTAAKWITFPNYIMLRIVAVDISSTKLFYCMYGRCVTLQVLYSIRLRFVHRRSLRLLPPHNIFTRTTMLHQAINTIPPVETIGPMRNPEPIDKFIFWSQRPTVC